MQYYFYSILAKQLEWAELQSAGTPPQQICEACPVINAASSSCDGPRPPNKPPPKELHTLQALAQSSERDCEGLCLHQSSESCCLHLRSLSIHSRPLRRCAEQSKHTWYCAIDFVSAYTELYDMIWCRDVKLQSEWPWPKLGAGMAQAGVSSMSHLDNLYI